ncbi:MAG: Na(+)/H(+) antiporter subunit D [Acidobacteriota bacterium]
MIASLPPGWILIVGALAIPLLKGRLQAAWMLLLPVLGFAQLLQLEHGSTGQLQLLGYELTLMRVDRLSLVFGYIFHLAALLSVIYALHVRDAVQHVSGMIYAGSAIGAVFAGDLLTLFIYWEVTAISSVWLIWARQTERSYRAGLRYLVIQVGSGVLLLSGVILQVHATGSLAFDRLIGADGDLGGASPGVLLIFIAFGIKCAFPLLHNWLQDSYPEATVTGTVFLSAFTTKLAVYALARGFAGTEVLIWIGVTMTLFPVLFAVIENDLRRVLAYSLNNQLGFMVVGVGVGTEMALNGTVAHAFCHILYKALLFMSMGAVLHRVGTIKATELGGLYKSMPWTAGFCIIGAASISAFPLFSGFISKSLILTAVADEHLTIIWIGLLIASAGVMEHSGIKIPFFAFFAHDSGRRCEEAPRNMLIAMGIAATLCVLIGTFPSALYSILPYSVDYVPYTSSHVVTQLQLLLFAALAFGVLMKTKIYPPEVASTNLDFDWVYRKALPAAVGRVASLGGGLWGGVMAAGSRGTRAALDGLSRLYGPRGIFARNWTTGSIALRVALMLGGYLLFYLFF